MTNTTWMDNTSGPGDVVYNVINSTNGSFIIGLMITLFIVVAVALKGAKKDFDEIFIYTGVLEFIIASYAISQKFIAFYWIMFPVALLFAGLMIRFFGQD